MNCRLSMSPHLSTCQKPVAAQEFCLQQLPGAGKTWTFTLDHSFNHLVHSWSLLCPSAWTHQGRPKQPQLRLQPHAGKCCHTLQSCTFIPLLSKAKPASVKSHSTFPPVSSISQPSDFPISEFLLCLSY